jgi:sensor histidine kinase YesM
MNFAELNMPSYQRHRTFFLHLSFWLLVAVYRFFDFFDFGGALTWAVVILPLMFYITSSYIHYFFILPIWIQQKKIGFYVFWLLLLIAANSTGKLMAEHKIYLLIRPELDIRPLTAMNVISAVWNTSSFLLFTSMMRLTLERFDLENKQKQLQNEKLTAELNYLKAQINPHFLFNTLHNLNYLVYSGAKNATDVIIKLSNIMRYMIYDANKERVPLIRELDYIKDYIHLESIRLNNSFELKFDTEGDLNQKEIAPLIFIPLIENAFKHGVKDSEQNCWVHVKVKATDSSVIVEVANRKLNDKNSNGSSGFGLDNLHKRLSLSYTNTHRLEVNESATEYKTILTLLQV